MVTDDDTLQTYEATAQHYRDIAAPAPLPELVALLDAACELLPPGATALELGTGPGRDTPLLEKRGVTVRRTDGAQSFVDMLRADGHTAELLDIRTDDLGGPHDLVVAIAVLLHLDRDELADLLRRLVPVAPVLAFTVKEGDGQAWSTDRLELPRRFTYWREAPLSELLKQTGWDVRQVLRATAREPWLLVLATRAD